MKVITKFGNWLGECFHNVLEIIESVAQLMCCKINVSSLRPRKALRRLSDRKMPFPALEENRESNRTIFDWNRKIEMVIRRRTFSVWRFIKSFNSTRPSV